MWRFCWRCARWIVLVLATIPTSHLCHKWDSSTCGAVKSKECLMRPARLLRKVGTVALTESVVFCTQYYPQIWHTYVECGVLHDISVFIQLCTEFVKFSLRLFAAWVYIILRKWSTERALDSSALIIEMTYLEMMYSQLTTANQLKLHKFVVNKCGSSLEYDSELVLFT